jgi:hypothetical protein
VYTSKQASNDLRIDRSVIQDDLRIEPSAAQDHLFGLNVAYNYQLERWSDQTIVCRGSADCLPHASPILWIMQEMAFRSLGRPRTP